MWVAYRFAVIQGQDLTEHLSETHSRERDEIDVNLNRYGALKEVWMHIGQYDSKQHIPALHVNLFHKSSQYTSQWQLNVTRKRKHIVQGSTAACRYPAISTLVRHSNSGLFTVKTFHWNLEPTSTTQHTSHTMRLTSIVSAFALLFSAASALEKPLDIQVTKAVECTRKTKSGKRHRRQKPSEAY